MKKQIPVTTKILPVALLILMYLVSCGTSMSGSSLINRKIGQLTHCDILAILKGNVSLAVNGIATDKAISVFSRDQVSSCHFLLTLNYGIQTCLINKNNLS